MWFGVKIGINLYEIIRIGDLGRLLGWDLFSIWVVGILEFLGFSSYYVLISYLFWLFFFVLVDFFLFWDF